MPDRNMAVVTGAARGIGREIAMHAARDGHDLIAAAGEPPVDEAAGRLL